MHRTRRNASEPVGSGEGARHERPRPFWLPGRTWLETGRGLQAGVALTATEQHDQEKGLNTDIYGNTDESPEHDAGGENGACENMWSCENLEHAKVTCSEEITVVVHLGCGAGRGGALGSFAG